MTIKEELNAIRLAQSDFDDLADETYYLFKVVDRVMELEFKKKDPVYIHTYIDAARLLM